MTHRAFIPNRSSPRPGVTIRSLFGNSSTSGDIGIEIECEGNKFKKTSLPEPWKYVPDGSLRGEDNAEYVFKEPKKFDEVPQAVNKLWDMFKDYGTVLDDSNRTSVHVHLNVQNFHLNRLCSFMGLYVAVEEILTAWCGDHRIGNLFCLRCKDAPAIVSKMKKFFQQDHDSQYVLTEGMHYAGMNAHAMMKYGSLEIRSLRGVTDPEVILDWVAILQRIYELSAEYEDPRTITDNFSGGGPIEFLRMVLGDRYDVVLSGIDMTDSQLRQTLMDGIRLAQDLCYCRDWSEYKPADVTKDPFNRNSKLAEAMTTIVSASNSPNISWDFPPQLAPQAPQGLFGSPYVSPAVSLSVEDDSGTVSDYWDEED